MVFILVVGVALDIIYVAQPFFATEDGDLWGKLCISCGIELSVIGFIGVLVCIGKYRHAEKRSAASGRRRRYIERQEELLDEADDDLIEGTYIPAHEVSDYITMGAYQSAEEKLAQIAKMDKTQFVIYVARLFSHKGYQVKLTPVTDNHDIDMLAEKMGVIIAVGCLISNRVLSREDVVRVRNGRRYYHANGCMALTNMYFDRSALDYAQAERISLVDRNLLVSDFMN